MPKVVWRFMSIKEAQQRSIINRLVETINPLTGVRTWLSPEYSQHLEALKTIDDNLRRIAIDYEPNLRKAVHESRMAFKERLYPQVVVNSYSILQFAQEIFKDVDQLVNLENQALKEFYQSPGTSTPEDLSKVHEEFEKFKATKSTPGKKADFEALLMVQGMLQTPDLLSSAQFDPQSVLYYMKEKLPTWRGMQGAVLEKVYRNKLYKQRLAAQKMKDITDRLYKYIQDTFKRLDNARAKGEISAYVTAANDFKKLMQRTTAEWFGLYEQNFKELVPDVTNKQQAASIPPAPANLEPEAAVQSTPTPEASPEASSTPVATSVPSETAPVASISIPEEVPVQEEKKVVTPSVVEPKVEDKQPEPKKIRKIPAQGVSGPTKEVVVAPPELSKQPEPIKELAKEVKVPQQEVIVAPPSQVKQPVPAKVVEPEVIPSIEPKKAPIAQIEKAVNPLTSIEELAKLTKSTNKPVQEAAQQTIKEKINSGKESDIVEIVNNKDIPKDLVNDAEKAVKKINEEANNVKRMSDSRQLLTIARGTSIELAKVAKERLQELFPNKNIIIDKGNVNSSNAVSDVLLKQTAESAEKTCKEFAVNAEGELKDLWDDKTKSCWLVVDGVRITDINTLLIPGNEIWFSEPDGWDKVVKSRVSPEAIAPAVVAPAPIESKEISKEVSESQVKELVDEINKKNSRTTLNSLLTYTKNKHAAIREASTKKLIERLGTKVILLEEVKNIISKLDPENEARVTAENVLKEYNQTISEIESPTTTTSRLLQIANSKPEDVADLAEEQIEKKYRNNNLIIKKGDRPKPESAKVFIAKSDKDTLGDVLDYYAQKRKAFVEAKGETFKGKGDRFDFFNYNGKSCVVVDGNIQNASAASKLLLPGNELWFEIIDDSGKQKPIKWFDGSSTEEVVKEAPVASVKEERPIQAEKTSAKDKIELDKQEKAAISEKTSVKNLIKLISQGKTENIRNFASENLLQQINSKNFKPDMLKAIQSNFTEDHPIYIATANKLSKETKKAHTEISQIIANAQTSYEQGDSHIAYALLLKASQICDDFDMINQSAKIWAAAERLKHG